MGPLSQQDKLLLKLWVLELEGVLLDMELDMDLDGMVAQPLYLPLVSSPGSATGTLTGYGSTSMGSRSLNWCCFHLCCHPCFPYLLLPMLLMLGLSQQGKLPILSLPEPGKLDLGMHMNLRHSWNFTHGTIDREL